MVSIVSRLGRTDSLGLEPRRPLTLKASLEADSRRLCLQPLDIFLLAEIRAKKNRSVVSCLLDLFTASE
jgi:hypothetical protein